ncbi:MAG: RluA family pseudouridine synthase [Luteitalea sp.]|nr:RluA family pseudouridine synthase [Luteitalea sp.]
MVTLEVPSEQADERLDRVLAALVPGRSRSQLQRLVRDGLVRVDGAVTTRVSERMRAGSRIEVEVPAAVPIEAAPEALPLDILYQDRDLIVVDKPAGMVVHPAAGHTAGTLVNALLHAVEDLSGVGGELRPGIVHRLDKGTSGVMVVAKNDHTHMALARQFHDREVGKEYVTLVWGVVQAGRRIDAPIGRDTVNRQKMSTRARRARSAVTRVVRAEHLTGVSLLHVAIATGRTHQVRVHLSAIGHPVVGDATYGGLRRRLPAHLRALGTLERPFLHAERLVIKHPTDDRRMEFTAPLAEDLQRVLDALKSRG